MESQLPSRLIDSPVGPLLLITSAAGLRAVVFVQDDDLSALRRTWSLATREVVVDDGHPLLSRAARELRAYFEGRREAFTLPLDVVGTPFQRQVWEALGRIPYGQTVTYTALAEGLGRPRAARAVAHACARNPLPILVPCHRVVGRDGDLTGYLGGLSAKRRLLSIERAEVVERPLLRLVSEVAPEAPAAASESEPDAVERWLARPDRQALATDPWLAEAMDAVPAEQWPRLAERLVQSGASEHAPRVDGLLDAWATEVQFEWPGAEALTCFLGVAACHGGPSFELVGRRLSGAPDLPPDCRDALEQAYRGIMAGVVPATAHARELSVDLWLALDPDRHLAALEATRADLWGALGADAADLEGLRDAADADDGSGE